MASSTAPRGFGCTCGQVLRLAVGLLPMFYYKETAFGFGCLFWFHQGRIPRHTCRFNCCLAAHQRTKEKDSAEPLSSILWTPPPHSGGYPLRRGTLAAAADRDIVSLFPVQTVCPHFDISFGCFVFGLGLFAFQKISVGLDRSFFIGGGWTVRSCGYVAFCYGYLLGLPLTATFFPILCGASPFHQ